MISTTYKPNKSNRMARPGYYILFHATIEATGGDCAFTDAYYADSKVMLWEYWDMVVNQLGVDSDHYSIAWCPSRNQAQKSAVKNWSK